MLMLKQILAGTLLALAVATTSRAAITVDGLLDGAYGSATAHVNYNPLAPNSNFGAPTNASDAIDYDIYLTSDANYVYGFLQTGSNGTAVGSFANVYFDVDPANANGSDIGFEITNNRAFIAGVPGYSSFLTGLLDFSTTATSVEFRLSNAAFTGPLGGLDYTGYPTFPVAGDKITLRLSQSFGYSVAGGATYGPDRLGSVILGDGAAVPEPATWAMMIGGFGLAGGMLRRRRIAAA